MAAASTVSSAPKGPLPNPSADSSGHDDVCRRLHNDHNQLHISSSLRQLLLVKNQDVGYPEVCITVGGGEDSTAISFASSDTITAQEQPAIGEHSSSEAKGALEGGEGSTSSDGSEECSTSSGGSNFWSKPHKSDDARWKAIRAIRSRNGDLVLGHFTLQKKLGSGDIGTVYLAELSGTNCCFAMKIMNKEALESRKKLPRAQTEREILERLDHPFLPTLYSHFETEQHSCLVMEYCPRGDLHALRQRQPGKCFSEQAAR